jgi:hypothetical protein
VFEHPQQQLDTDRTDGENNGIEQSFPPDGRIENGQIVIEADIVATIGKTEIVAEQAELEGAKKEIGGYCGYDH